MFLQTGGGILGVGTPEVVVICLVGWFILGPKELYILAKEIGKLVAQARNALAESAAEWQSTIDKEFEFEGLNDVKAAAAELQDAFDFRSSRYMNEFRESAKAKADVELVPSDVAKAAAASTAAAAASKEPLGNSKDVDEWNTAMLSRQERGVPNQLDVDDWNASIMGANKDDELTGLSSVLAAEAPFPENQSDEFIDQKRKALDRIQAAYERKRREIDLEFEYERDKLSVELATSVEDIPSSAKNSV